PAAEITVLTEAPYAWLFTDDPDVDRVLAAPPADPRELFWHEDVVVRRALARHGPFTRLALLSDRLDNLGYMHSGLPMHAFYCEQAGVPEGGDHAPVLALAERHRAAARRRLQSLGIGGRYAVLHTRAGWAEKTPPDALLGQIVEVLAGE